MIKLRFLIILFSFIFLVGCTNEIYNQENLVNDKIEMIESDCPDDKNNITSSSDMDNLSNTNNELKQFLNRNHSFNNLEVSFCLPNKEEINFQSEFFKENIQFYSSYSNTKIICGFSTDINPEIKNIALYDVNNNEYESLFQIPSSHGIAPYSNDKYMAYKYVESENNPQNDYNYKATIWIYDFETSETYMIFEHSVDENGNIIYFNDNDMVVYKDEVYFNDYKIDETTGLPSPTLYCYNIKEKEVNVVRERCQQPMLYKDSILAFVPNDEGNYKVIFDISNNKKFLDVEDSIRDIKIVEDEIFTIINHKTDHKAGVTTFAVKNLTTNEIIMTTTDIIYRLEYANGRLYWGAYYKTEPFYYDTRSREIVFYSEMPASRHYYYPLAESCIVLAIVPRVNTFKFVKVY